MSRAGAAEAARPVAPLRSAGAGGFTLLEILVVLLLLGLLTAVAAPRFDRLRQPTLTEVGRDVVAALRAQRSQAMRTGRPVLAAATGLPVPAGFVLGPAQPPPDGAVAGVLFLPDGRSSGTVLLLSQGTDQVRVIVDWLTGEIRVAGP